MHNWPSKDPNEVLDYQVDWTSRLVAGETIVSSTFIVASGDVVIDSEAPTAGAVNKVWLSGGTAGSVSVLTNRITTSAGRTYDESCRLRIQEN